MKHQEKFFEEVDQARNQGRGSPCTVWSFFILSAIILITGIVIIIFWFKK